RDRATFFLKIMEDGETAEKYVKDDATYSLGVLERQLVQYVSSPDSTSKPFDISSVPVITKAQAEAESLRERSTDIATIQTIGTTTSVLPGPTAAPTVVADRNVTPTPNVDQQQLYAQQLEKVPEIAAFGHLFKSSTKPVELTESETEY
ncbi:7392_t:CDS:2, partial [Paraglomus occultum]